jgi:membrane protein YdbS with pleckstrin-like domain
MITALVMSSASLVGAVILSFTPVPGWLKLAAVAAWVGLSVVLLVIALRWPAIHHRHLFYRVNDEGLRIRRGVWWRAVIDVPRSRVQHTDVSQGPIERGFGLATLSVFTAGTEHARVALEGLGHQTALRIRDHLIEGQGVDAV